MESLKLPQEKKIAISLPPWITHRFQNTYDSLSEALPNWLAKLKKEIK